MNIEIISSGLSATLQDDGRMAFLDKGIPACGFMDANAAHLANGLLNNAPNTVLIEMMLLGIKFRTNDAIAIAITGANMHPKVNGKEVAMNKVLQIPKDGIVSLSGASTGMYGYIAFAGEIEVAPVFGSKSTYVPAAIGGVNGKALEKGMVLSISNPKPINVHAKVKTNTYLNSIEVACLKGPEWELFSLESQTQFLNSTYTVSKNSNRIGIRLEGTLISMPVVDEIISSGIVKGTVQITKAGNPIVMMADAPTTGGYLRMVNLTEKAINQLAQLPIGGTVTFKIRT
ncbi:5-oxoprolinase subunit C family protein [Wenyingzhuangia aestuarii]|uniref:5-oxoprolinase subunit C family protein n=1 Tax=Wenyingzhuangia aestuarii TaxID=1647582 RepID=UPI00143AF2D6|nr:biotin-dependent carboxyltransferase family protein [Wenyingzhuangia aestuarii]NJB82763.1 antagonist of KipI [Wenyingzhuangia aestuarii]